MYIPVPLLCDRVRVWNVDLINLITIQYIDLVFAYLGRLQMVDRVRMQLHGSKVLFLNMSHDVIMM